MNQRGYPAISEREMQERLDTAAHERFEVWCKKYALAIHSNVCWNSLEGRNVILKFAFEFGREVGARG